MRVCGEKQALLGEVIKCHLPEIKVMAFNNALLAQRLFFAW